MIEEQFKQAASLAGDPTRASILWALLEGKALTATELSIVADTTPQNTSMHLGKLVQAGWLTVNAQGRHRYYTFARQEIAYAIEALATLVPAGSKLTTSPENISGIKFCRTCYNHLAGKAGVLITDSLLKQKLLLEQDTTYAVSKKGLNWFLQLGIDTEELKTQRRSFARVCLDWSERRHHLAGALGAALLEKMLKQDWLRKSRSSRAVIITAKGQKALQELFNLTL